MSDVHGERYGRRGRLGAAAALCAGFGGSALPEGFLARVVESRAEDADETVQQTEDGDAHEHHRQEEQMRMTVLTQIVRVVQSCEIKFAE